MQVYCVDCEHFTLKEFNQFDGIPSCKHEAVCDIRDCEDSRNIKYRPFYKGRVE